MTWAINGLMRGEFLELPGVGTAATVGVISTAMALGLEVLGFRRNENVATAIFTIAGTGGMAITVIGAIAYTILAVGMQRGNHRAMQGY